MKFVISLAILFFSVLSLAKTPFADFRPRQMQENSKLLIHFDNPQIFTKEGIEWGEKIPGGYRTCNLQIHSYYDEDLAKRTKTAVYYITQVQGQSSLYGQDKGQFKKEDDFIYWLTTENKDLPYLSFECRMRVNSDAKKSYFSLADIEAFTGLDDIFLDPIYNESRPSPSIGQMLPNKLTLETFIDLKFSSKKRGNGIGVDVPYFTDGHLTKEGEKVGCSVRYRYRTAEIDEEGTTILPKGQKATLFAAHELGFYLNIDFHTADGSSITLVCSNNGGVDLDYVRHHFGDAVKVTEVVP